MSRGRVVLGALLAATSHLMIGIASAAPVTWTDWTAISTSAASGNMGGVTVGVTANSGSMNGPSQTACGTNWWTQPNPSSPAYTGGSVSNAPTACEQVGLNTPVSITVSFSSAISNLYMALLSVGQQSVTVTYDFDTPFTIDSEGQGFWGDGTFTTGAGDTLAMSEFHGGAGVRRAGVFAEFHDHTGRVLARVHVRLRCGRGSRAEHAGGSWPRLYCSRFRPPPQAVVAPYRLSKPALVAGFALCDLPTGPSHLVSATCWRRAGDRTPPYRTAPTRLS